MEQYTKNRLKALGIDPTFDPFPLCEPCLYKGAITRANDCDHIDGRGGKRDKSKLLTRTDNLIFVCRPCHESKSSSDRILWREISVSHIERAREKGKYYFIYGRDL